MTNMKRIQHTLIYLFSPEDSSESFSLATLGNNLQPSSTHPTWITIIKSLVWMLLAILVPLALITLFT